MKRIYYFIQSEDDATDAALYIGRVELLEQNKRSALYVVSPVVLHSVLKSRANADHVKNLSPQFLRRAKYEQIQSHQLLLCENF